MLYCPQILQSDWLELTGSITSVLKNCIGFLLNIAQCLKQPYLFTCFFILVFPRYFAPYLSSNSSSYSTRQSQSSGNYLVAKVLPFYSKFCQTGCYSFVFDTPNTWNAFPDEIFAPSSLATFTKQLTIYNPWHTNLNINSPLAFSVVPDLFSVPGYQNWLTVLELL